MKIKVNKILVASLFLSFSLYPTQRSCSFTSPTKDCQKKRKPERTNTSNITNIKMGFATGYGGNKQYHLIVRFTGARNKFIDRVYPGQSGWNFYYPIYENKFKKADEKEHRKIKKSIAKLRASQQKHYAALLHRQQNPPLPVTRYSRNTTTGNIIRITSL